MSRPTIREAIIALEATNKVSVKTWSGIYVLDSSRKQAQISNAISPFEVIEARALLEGEAAALAAKMITDDEIILLENAYKELEDEAPNDHSKSTYREFHSIIANATHNSVIANQIHALWDLQENISHFKEAHHVACSKKDTYRIKQHHNIMQAIVNHDSIAARHAMHKHFSNVLESMHSALEEEAVNTAKRKGSLMRKRFSLGLFASVD